MLAIRRNPGLMLSPVNHTPKHLLDSIIPNLNQDSKISLRRGKPNTIRTGLRDPTPLRSQPASRHRNSLNECDIFSYVIVFTIILSLP